MNQREKSVSFQISHICAILDGIKRGEPKGSAKWNVIHNLELRVNRALAVYNSSDWQDEEMVKASKLYDLLISEVAQMFPPLGKVAA